MNDPALSVFREFKRSLNNQTRFFTLRGRELTDNLGTGLQSSVGGILIVQGCSHSFLPDSGANRGGRERTVTTACPSLAASMAHVRKHGSVCATRAGWAACVTKVSLIKAAPRRSYLHLPPTPPDIPEVSHRASGTHTLRDTGSKQSLGNRDSCILTRAVSAEEKMTKIKNIYFKIWEKKENWVN